MNGLTVTDLFCGAGGSSTGLVAAGYTVVIAANHWARAIESHQLNHPNTDHSNADISQVDPRYFPTTDILWASPECTNHSIAKGVKRQRAADAALFELNGTRPLVDDAANRSRATMWDVPRFAEHHRYKAIIIENVVDAHRWVQFPAWLLAMELLGYKHEIVWLVMRLDDSGKYASALRRNVDLGFDHLSDDFRGFLASHAARLARRWVLVFSDTESAHLWVEDLEEAGLDYVRAGAWIKRGSTPQFSGDRPATEFEAITIAHSKGRKRWNGGGSHAVWDVPIVLNRSHSAKSERVHPTQKPLRLMQKLVEQFTDPGDVILDPTAGSGTTGVAAKLLSRRAILVERDEVHAEAAAKRLAAAVPPELVPITSAEPFDFGSLA